MARRASARFRVRSRTSARPRERLRPRPGGVPSPTSVDSPGDPEKHPPDDQEAQTPKDQTRNTQILVRVVGQDPKDGKGGGGHRSEPQPWPAEGRSFRTVHSSSGQGSHGTSQRRQANAARRGTPESIST